MHVYSLRIIPSSGLMRHHLQADICFKNFNQLEIIFKLTIIDGIGINNNRWGWNQSATLKSRRSSTPRYRLTNKSKVESSNFEFLPFPKIIWARFYGENWEWSTPNINVAMTGWIEYFRQWIQLRKNWANSEIATLFF